MGGSGERAGEVASEVAAELTRRLALLLLGSEPSYRYTEMAQAAGIDPGRAVRLWQALGLASPGPDAVLFTEVDVDALKLVKVMSSLGVSPSAELAAARGWGQAMARVAEWQVEMVRGLATPSARDSDPAQARDRVLSLGSEVMPAVEQFQHYVWRRHLLAAAERLLCSASTAPGQESLAVGFADIAGFTDVSRGLTDARLAEFIDGFEAQSTAIVTANGGRVIKTIGDEVMFVADQSRAAAEIALRLAQVTSSLDGRPNLHIGIAYGHVLHYFGDVHGTVVNLASRLTSLARAGSVLVDDALAAALTPPGADGASNGDSDGQHDHSGYQVRKLRPVAVRGFPHLQPWLLRRAPDRSPRGQRGRRPVPS